MGMRFALCMVMITFSRAATDELVGAPPSCSNLPYLDEWLCNAKFTLPTFALQSALLTVTITEMQCYGARISELSTTPNPTAGGGKAPTLAFTFGATDIYCESSRVHVGKGILSTWTSMTLTVSSITSSATIELAVDHDGLPASAQLLNNKAELGDLKLSIFHFLELGWLVDLLRPIIINKVVSTVNNLVSHNVTALLENVDAMVKPLLSTPPLLPETENYPSAIDWRHSVALEETAFVLDKVIGPDGPFGLNGVVRSLTGGTGEVILNGSALHIHVEAPIGGLGNVSVALGTTTISGLDSVEALDLLIPVQAADGARSINSSLALHAVMLNTSLVLGFAPGGSISATTLSLPMTLRVNLEDIVAGAVLFAPVNSSISIGQLLKQHTCLGAAVLDASLRRLQLRLSPKQFWVDGPIPGLAKLVAKAINDVLELFNDAFEVPIREAIDGVAGGPVQNATNTYIHELIGALRADTRCDPIMPDPVPPTTPDAVDWRENSVLSLVDFALDQVVGADGPLGVNGLVHELTGGALQLDTSRMNPVVSGHFGPLGVVNVSLLEAGVAGLDRMTELALLEPVASDGTLLRSEIGVDGLSVSVRLSVSTSLMKAPVDFGFNVTLHQAVIGATMRVALNQTGLTRLEVGEWVQLGCIAREVEGIAVPAMNLSSHLVDLSVWGNEWGERKASSVSLSVPAQLPKGAETLVLHATNKALAALLATARGANCTASPPAPMPPPCAHDTVDWRENSVLSLVDFALDQVVGADGPLGVNGLVHELTGGALQLDTSSMNPVVSGHFGPLGVVNVSLLEAGVAGLDRMTELALLEPVASDGTLLRSEIGVDGLSVSVRLSVSTSLMKAPVDFGFNVTLHQAVIGTTMRVALNQTGLTRLEVGEWVQLGCIAREVEGIAVPAMNLSSHLVDLSVWGNEWGERKASSVSLSVPAQLPKGAETLVLHATNKALAALLATARKASCTANPPAPMPPPGAHDTVDWRENSVLSLVDFALDQVVGADGPLGVNGLVHELTGGALQLDTSSMNPVVSGHFGPLGVVNVSLLEAGVAGLDRMTELALLEPVASDGTLLRSEIGVDVLSVSVRLSVSTSLMKAPVDFGFNVTLHQAVIGATMRVALNQTGLARLEVGEWVQLGCIAREVEGIAVPAMNLSSHLVDLSVWGNEWGERKASSVSLSVPAQLPKGAEALVLHATNKALSALLATARSAACSHGAPTPPPPPPPSTNISSDTVDWRNSIILDVLSLLEARIGDALIRTVVPSGSFAVDVSAVKPFKFRNMNVSLLEAGVAGLDKWTELTLFQPVASDGTLLHSEIGVDGLSVSVRLSVSTSLTKAPVDFGFNVTLHQAVIGATTRVALNKTGLGALQAHQVLNSTSCIMQQIEAFDFEDLTLQMRSIELAVWGNEWSTRPSSSVKLLQPLPPSPSLVRRLRNVLNPLVTSKLVALQSPFCPRHNSPPLHVMDYRSSASVARMASHLNVAIPAFLKRVDHVLIPIAIPLPPVHDPKLGTIRVRLSNVNISGLSSVFNFSVLNPDPDDPIRLQNQIGFYGSQPLAGHMTLQVQLDGMWHSFDIVMDAQGVIFDLGIRLGLDPGYAGSLSAAELMARPSCMLQPIVNASLTAGSRTDILSALGGYLAMSITTQSGGHALLNESVMPSHLRGTFEAVLSVLDSKLQQTLDRQHSECLYGPPPPPPPTPADAGLSSVAWLLIILGLMLSLPVLICIARRHFRKPSARELEQMANCASGRLELIDKLDENGFPVDPRKGHLAAHYPPLYRIAFSVLIVANMCLYAVAHSTPGATMNVLLKIAGETVLLPDIFIFTLPGSVRDEWNSGSYALASLVAAASGIWPFLKLSSNLIMWWMPSRWMSIDKQGLAIRFLDATGKFVITDTQMVVLLMVAFRFSILAQGEGEAHVADADVVVTPDIGVTTFIIATFISLVIGHTHVHMHRSARRVFRMDMKGHRGIGCNELGATPLDGVQVDLARVPDQTIVASRSTALCKLHFNKLLCYKDRKIPLFLRMLVPIMLVVCSTGIIIGCQMTSFSITIEGLVGSLVGRGSKTDWSLTLLAEKIPTVTHLASPVLMRTLQVGFFLTCCVIPVLDAALCAFLWCVPLRRSTQHTLLVVCEIGLAWSMLEVLAIILLTSLLSLDQFAKFSLGDECTGINHLLQSYPELANKVLPEGSERDCLGIVPSLENGYYVFAAAALISVPFCLLVLHTANTALEQQASQAQKSLSDYTAVHPSARSSEAPQRGGLATPLLAE
ncbi:hypothetical protein AB1Y20_005872 [Prymnesium parvum]|uniref:Uncharacterized protein n=1 Tax=Prymnesium parvum TaxID=97485 RepID=A0AB34J102_PRYPA